MRKKEDIVTKYIVLNPVFYNIAKDLLDEYCILHPVKRRREFDNNYWSLINILYKVLYDKKPQKYNIVKNYSKYGEEIKLDNLHAISGMRKKEVFMPLMKFFEKKNFVIPIRNEKGNKNYTGGSEKYTSRATIYYIPLQLVLQMQKYEQEHGEAGECIEIEVSKKNVFYNEEARKQKQKQREERLKKEHKPVRVINGIEIYHNQLLLPWVEEAMNNSYKDFKKWPSDWQMIDIVRIGDLEYDEEQFLRIAAEIGVENPVEYLRKCKESGKIGNVRLLHGRVFRYGWNHLKTELRKAIIYHGQHIVPGADFHCADFKMMAVIAWMRREDFKIKVDELERFTEAVKGDFYQSFIDWYKEKYKVELDRDVAKEGLLRFRNDTNSNKKNDERYKQIREYFEQYYPTITKGMLYSYREITVEGLVKNCISTHCQNVEGYIIHERVLPAIEDLVSEPFSMCDAIWIKESDLLKAPIIEDIFDHVFSDLIFDIKNKHTSFEFEQLKNIITN